MTPLTKEIRHAGKTWTVGQRVNIPYLSYEGVIISLWPGSGTQPSRAHVKREKDRYIRVATLDKLRVME